MQTSALERMPSLEVLEQEAALLEAQLAWEDGLPHLYGQKMYRWQREFHDSRCTYVTLVASNQSGKSAIQIRKCINWATNKELWPSLWKTQPIQFWYLYPDSSTATREFEEKWVREFLPRGVMKDHEVYGWKKKMRDGDIDHVRFNSGVTIYFKSYSQNVHNLQAGSVHGIFCFTSGHLVHTTDGLKRVEDISIGDMAMTRNGPRPVSATMNRISKVFKFHFSNGETLEGTLEHPIFTNKGWIELGKLTPDHTCYGVQSWKLQKRLSSLMALLMPASQAAKTTEAETTSETKRVNIFTSLSGKPSMNKKFQRATLFIISTLIRLTTALPTFSFSPGKNIQEYTKKKSGEKLRPIHLSAISAGPTFYRGLQNQQSLDTVLSPAEKRELGQDKKVFNITVDGDHEYFANGILTHNCDEEIPFTMIPELQMRIMAYDGYMNFAFTATRGQEEWRKVVEERGKDETWKEGEVDIKKIQVTAYDCLYYEDGTPSKIWTVEKIEEAKKFLHTEAQVKRRIYGRFVKDEGLKYPCFLRKNHIVDLQDIDLGKGHVYAGVDYGSGTNHQSSICFVWTNKDHTYGYVFDIWVGDKGIPTDAGSVVAKYKEMVEEHGCTVTRVFYDWACADLKTIANSTGLFFEPAEKGHATGERIVNTLFKFNMLKVMREGSWEALAQQLESITTEENKKYAVDDAADSLRYALTKIPWEYTDLTDKPAPIPINNNPRTRFKHTQKQEEPTLEDELDEWNDLINDLGYEDF